MKRKILSILLIIFMLSASVITIPVKAKILNEGDNSWWENDDTFMDADVTEATVYDELDEYLNIHATYGLLEKEHVTRMFLSCGGGKGLAIKDLSDIYTYPNLKELCIWNMGDETTQAALDALDFSRLQNLEKLYIEGVDITNLEIGKLTNLTYLSIVDPFVHASAKELYIDIDLSNMNKLEYFKYFISELPKGSEYYIKEQIASHINPPVGFEVYVEYESDYPLPGACFTLIEKLDIEIKTNKTNYAVNEPIMCNVKLGKPMEMTDFRLYYDTSKLEFIDVDIEEDFYNFLGYNSSDQMTISVAWIALDEVGIDEVNFNFRAIGDGQTEIELVPYGFATGDLDNAFEYTGSKQIINIDTDYVKDNAQIKVDYTNIDGEDFSLISGLKLTDNKVTFQDLLNLAAFEDGVTVKAYKNNGVEILAEEGLGTGSKIKLYKGEELVGEFDIIVYGDVSGDGEITTLDALTLIRAENGKLPQNYNWSTIYWSAGMVFTGHQDVHGPSAIDALAIIKHLNGKYQISQYY